MISYRKIGGLHWFTIGRIRISFCIKRNKPAKLLPLTKWTSPTLPSITLDPHYHAYWSHRDFAISKGSART